MKLLFGRNRRQHPLIVKCPGGEVRISREFGGAVRVVVVGIDGPVEVVAPASTYSADLRLAYQQPEVQP